MVVVVPEVAESDFQRWADKWRIDTDVATMKEDAADSFEDQRRRLVRRIVEGSLRVDNTGDTLVYELEFPQEGGTKELTFRVPTGGAMLGWDRMKERESIKKLNSYMASMCGTNPVVFAQMDGRDLKIAQAVATLFLGS